MKIPGIDQVVRSKRRTIAILVERGGRVTVRAPLRAPEALIRQFVESKSGWIAEKKALAALQAPKTATEFKGGEKIPFLGQDYLLRVVEGPKAALRFENGFLLTPKALPLAATLLERWFKAAARKTLQERVDFYAAMFGLAYEKVRISSAQTRWGSCSSRGTLSFTWRLVMAPLDVVDYVVIHELAHLKVPNHSAEFWATVAGMMPGYKRHVAWLKKNGASLTLGE